MRELKITILIALLLFLNSIPTIAQGGIVGGIAVYPTKSKLGQLLPLDGANVSLEGTKFKQVTDSTGKFSFFDVPAGNYKLVATRAGYFPDEKQITVGMGMPVNVTLILVPDNRQPISTEPGKTRQASGKKMVYVAFAALPSPETHAVAPSVNPNDPQLNNLNVLQAIVIGGDPYALGGNPKPPMVGAYDPVTPVNVNPNSLMLFDPDSPATTSYIKLNSRPYWILYNPYNEMLYISNESHQIMIMDTTQQNSWVGAVGFQGVITDLKLTSGGKFLLAGLMSNFPRVAIIDTSNGKIIKTVDVLKRPQAIATSPDGRILFVATGASYYGSVLVFDLFSGTPRTKIDVGNNPIAMEASPTKNEIYVANYNSGTISVINTESLSVTNTIKAGVQPTCMAISPDGGKLYVTLSGSDSVGVIDVNQGIMTNAIPVGKNPMGIAMSSDGRKIFVANNKSGTLSVIDTRADMVIQTTTALPQSQPWGVAVK